MSLPPPDDFNMIKHCVKLSYSLAMKNNFDYYYDLHKNIMYTWDAPRQRISIICRELNREVIELLLRENFNVLSM